MSEIEGGVGKPVICCVLNVHFTRKMNVVHVQCVITEWKFGYGMIVTLVLYNVRWSV